MNTEGGPLTPRLYNPAEDGVDWHGPVAANDNFPLWFRALPYLIPLGILVDLGIGLSQNLVTHGSVFPRS